MGTLQYRKICSRSIDKTTTKQLVSHFFVALGDKYLYFWNIILLHKEAYDYKNYMFLCFCSRYGLEPTTKKSIIVIIVAGHHSHLLQSSINPYFL